MEDGEPYEKILKDEFIFTLTLLYEKINQKTSHRIEDLNFDDLDSFILTLYQTDVLTKYDNYVNFNKFKSLYQDGTLNINNILRLFAIY